MSLKKEDLEERLVEPSAHPAINDDDELASISSRNHEKNSSTFSPKAVNDEEQPKNHDIKVVVNSKKQSIENDDKETLSCCETDCCCCNCWRENRFAIMLMLVLLVGLAVPLYILIRFAHFEFDFHKECVECFDGKQPNQVVFDQTRGSCDPFVQNLNYDSNRVVLDPNFCGAPHCQNLELLPGLRLVPYWSIAASAVFSIVLSAGVNLLKYGCYLPIKKKFVKWKWDEEVVEQNPLLRLAEFENEILDEAKRMVPGSGFATDDVESQVKVLRQFNMFLKTFGLTDPWLFVLLFLFALGHFSFSVYEVETKPTFAHLDGWHKYQTIYGLFLNSGSIEVLWFWLSMGPLGLSLTRGARSEDLGALTNFLKGRHVPGVTRYTSVLLEEFDKFQDNIVANLLLPTYQFKSECASISFMIFYIMIAVLATLPVFLTHIIPGLVLFIPYWSWIFILLAIVLVLTVVLTSCCASMYLPSMALRRLTGSFFVLLLFPTIFNWTVLFYEGRTWSDVMTGEYRLRNTDCYFNALVNSIQIYNIGFVGLIFS